jgi:alkanesulfonate monooxygenase SsuD/methylene tetrahydromethanopterin reductase-like flavin-dependent oxidoreductase (luciferase family)
MRRGAITAGRSPDDLSVSLLIPTFIHADLATARRAAREFLVHYASQAHYAKVFTASGFGAEMEAVRKASGNQDLAAAMAALSDRLLDSILLAGPASRCRDGLESFREAGVDWALLGPQRVGHQSLAEQAHVLIRALEPG